MSSEFAPAAGVVILKHFDGAYNVLCLKTKKGNYDLTKGIIDPGETAFQTALREAKEEAGISEIKFPFGKDSVSSDACEMFVGTTDQTPHISPNPHTGIYEHFGYVWLPIEDAVNSEKIKNFLMPAVKYAYELVLKSR